MDQYFRKLRLELSETLALRKKIYLDMRFWILLRDATLNPNQSRKVDALLLRLRSAVSSGRAICPVSASSLMELFKQPFTEQRRIATAKIMDELSLGVSVCSPEWITTFESFYLIRTLYNQHELHSADELIWTKVFFAFGEQYPSYPALSESEERKLQRKAIAKLWDLSCEGYVRYINDKPIPEDPDELLSQTINSQNAEHADDFGSFREIFEIELKGGIDVTEDITQEVLQNVLSGMKSEETVPPNFSHNLLLRCFADRPNTKFILRYLYANTVIHAQMRLNKGRKFKPNDFLDFQHGAIAMSYFDAFFTERSLKHLLTQHNADLRCLNACRVTCDIDEACDYVEELMV